MSETKPKKMVSRSIALTLGIVCIVLIAGLAGTFEYNMNIIKNKDAMYNGYVVTHSYTNDEFSAIVNHSENMSNIAELLDSTVVVQDTVMNQSANHLRAGASWNFSATHAGFVLVEVYTYTSVYAQVTYTSYAWASTEPLHYDQRTDLAYESNGNWYAIFPVLPSNNVQVKVGYTNDSGNAEDLLSIRYVY